MPVYILLCWSGALPDVLDQGTCLFGRGFRYVITVVGSLPHYGPPGYTAHCAQCQQRCAACNRLQMLGARLLLAATRGDPLDTVHHIDEALADFR